LGDGKPDFNARIAPGPNEVGFDYAFHMPATDDKTLSDTFNAKALDFIRKNKAKPFFLYYAAHEPHVPRDPNPRFVGKSGLGPRSDAILQLDDEVAQLMKTIKEEGLDDHTLVIFSSDNGGDVGRHVPLVPTQKSGHRPNGNYRGGKYNDFEGGQRMPFIARWPGHIQPGGVSAEPISLIDLPATAAALTGQKLAPADAPDSLDILPVLTTAGAKSPHDALYYGNAEAAGIREGQWKLIVKKQGPGKDTAGNVEEPTLSPPLLYDLEKAVRDGFTRAGAQKSEVR
jgi:arylsulfatase A-like enzyme